MASDKQLKNKAVSIKGKAYVMVSDRVVYFNDEFKNGGIETSYDLLGETYHFKATVTPDFSTPERKFTGHSQATIGDGMVNKTAAMENAETSAVGRALAMMGIGVIESIASADEMNKATGSEGGRTAALATAKQIDWMRGVAEKKGGGESAEDLDKYIESVLTIPPQRVPAFKVKDAVDKLQQQESTSEALKEIQSELLEEGIDVKKLPY